MEEYDLLQKPYHLMKLDYHIMVCRTGPKNPCCIDSGGKSQITVVGYISAAGYCVPPRKLYFASQC